MISMRGKCPEQSQLSKKTRCKPTLASSGHARLHFGQRAAAAGGLASHRDRRVLDAVAPGGGAPVALAGLSAADGGMKLLCFRVGKHNLTTRAVHARRAVSNAPDPQNTVMCVRDDTATKTSTNDCTRCALCDVCKGLQLQPGAVHKRMRTMSLFAAATWRPSSCWRYCGYLAAASTRARWA